MQKHQASLLELRNVERSQNLLEIDGLRHIEQFASAGAIGTRTVRLNKSLGKASVGGAEPGIAKPSSGE